MAVFATGLGAPETPRLHPDGGWLCVEMAGRPGVTHVDDDGTSRRIAPAGCPNGLTVATDGSVFVADTVPPALLRVSMDGTVEKMLSEGDAGPFLLPNDLCFAPSGLLYMTDSGMTMGDWVVDGAPRPDWQTAPFDGKLWEIDTTARTARALDRGLRFANGIAVGPDGMLYVNEMITGDVVRYAVTGGRVTGPREAFANVLADDWAGGFRGPDGMGFSCDGRLWCTVYGEGVIAVIDAGGAVIDRIATAGNAPTNVAFGRNGKRKLYVTEHQNGAIEVFDVDGEGLPLLTGPAG